MVDGRTKGARGWHTNGVRMGVDAMGLPRALAIESWSALRLVECQAGTFLD